VTAFWESLGCRVRSLSPREHDEAVALVSHLPHFLAAALVNTIAAENRKAFDFAGPGFRDTSRVASGPPAMWAEIFAHNRTAVKKSAEAMIEKLRESLKLLDSPTQDNDLHMNEFLSQAKAERDRLRLPR
jgi:prephenate dehydrogenase